MAARVEYSHSEKPGGLITIVADGMETPKDGIYLSLTTRSEWGGKVNTHNAFARLSLEDLIGLSAVVNSVIRERQPQKLTKKKVKK